MLWQKPVASASLPCQLEAHSTKVALSSVIGEIRMAPMYSLTSFLETGEGPLPMLYLKVRSTRLTSSSVSWKALLRSSWAPI